MPPVAIVSRLPETGNGALGGLLGHASPEAIFGLTRAHRAMLGRWFVDATSILSLQVGRRNRHPCGMHRWGGFVRVAIGEAGGA